MDECCGDDDAGTEVFADEEYPSMHVHAFRSCGHDHGFECGGGNEYDGRMGLRISAIFVIGVGSMLGMLRMYVVWDWD